MPSKHAEYSPSAAYRWLKCPGSVPLSKDIPETTNPSAEKGTELHNYAEQILRGNKPPKPNHSVMSAIAYVNHVKSIESATSKTYVEQLVKFPGLEKEVWGTADAVVNDDGVVTVLDYKSGVVPVPAHNNPQLLIYGVGAFFLFKGKALNVGISQDEQLDLWPVPLSTLFDFQEEVTTAVNDKTTLRSGDHCKYCPASAICPEQKKTAMALIESDFKDEKPALPDPAFVPIDQLELILQKKKQLEDWLGAIAKYLQDKAANGTVLQHFQIGKGRKGNRKWIDPDRTEAALKAEGWSSDDIKSLKSPTEIEKLVGKKFVTPLVEQSEGRDILVPKQPAEDFSILEEGE